MFSGKTLLITGGTGSFGRACLDRFVDSDVKEIRIFSRDEMKQHEMRHVYRYPDKVSYFIGDVRNYASIASAMRGVDYVFHAAALKEVPSCEFFPLEAVRTNILGADNTIRAAIAANVRAIVCLSTDKAAYPINAMGMTKALMEKILIARSRDVTEGGTVVCGTRYGNVMCSRGSVIPLFISQIQQGRPITITDPLMTRFLMHLEEAIDLVIHAFTHAEQGDIFVRKSPASTIGNLAQAVLELFQSSNGIRYIGKRHGEKMSETLLTVEEMAKAVDEGEYYRVPTDTRGLNYDRYFFEGITEARPDTSYNSDNARQLTVEEIKVELLKIPYVRAELARSGLSVVE